MLLNESLGYSICRTARKIHQQLSNMLAGYDITAEQWAALRMLLERNGISQKQLALLLDKDANTTKAIADRLEKKGLICRSVNPADRRAFLLEPSEAGRELGRRLQPVDEAAEAVWKSLLEPEECEQLLYLLEKIERKTEP